MDDRPHCMVKLDLTTLMVKVNGREDMGTVKIPKAREPQVGKFGPCYAQRRRRRRHRTGRGVAVVQERRLLIPTFTTLDESLQTIVPSANGDNNLAGHRQRQVAQHTRRVRTPTSTSRRRHRPDGGRSMLPTEVPYCLRATATYTDDLPDRTMTDGVQRKRCSRRNPSVRCRGRSCERGSGVRGPGP